MPLKNLDRSKLSSRENDVFNLAIEGLTDQQIASRLSITTSTVNSYWVRIRGKLGHFTRTELVASALRSEAKGELERVLEKTRQLETLASQRFRMLSGSNNPGLFQMAFEITPEAMVILDGSGSVTYANRRCELAFDYRVGELAGQPFTNLVHEPRNPRDIRYLESFLREPRPMSLGVDTVIYGRRRGGSEFRILLLLDGQAVGDEVVSCVIIRNFIDEIDLRRRASSTITQLL
jgi:PAS domain S-box-containing protein